ncbi:MAG TPA: PAS domain S-box protein [Chryseosolibacter sp.]|nr:PAS domain S-box protein [Chryseosolibacter sp.]
MKASNTSKATFKGHTEILLNRMIEEIQDYAIILLDKGGHVIHWNRGAESIKGYTEEDILGQHFSIFYSQEDRDNHLPDRILAEAVKNGKAVYEGWRKRKDGTIFWGSIVLTSLHGDDGEVLGFSKLTRDLTERKKSEDRMAAKNKELMAMNQELASFAYVASHDLQEPLRKIQTFLSRIEEMEKDHMSERAADYFRRVQAASQRAQTLIQDLLTYSRATTDQRKFEKVDLNQVVQAVKKEYSDTIREKHAVVEVSNLPVVNAIQFQMHQLFVNIIGNSLKFSRPGAAPRIVINSELIPADLVTLSEKKSDFFYHITVNDNGIGFEPEYNLKVFELFQRLHGRSEYSGTGIGLAICKKIVENHFGAVRAEGRGDDGATFHIYLPREIADR